MPCGDDQIFYVALDDFVPNGLRSGNPDQRKTRSRASSATISPDKVALTSGGCATVWI
jgi:hypothetical protein